MIPLFVLLAAYTVGAIPFGYLVVKLKSGQDVRASGSGNIGATNVLRSHGRGMGVVTLLLDIAKGAFAVWLADRFLEGSAAWMSAAALAVMAGHAFPVFLRFRGGKAVASFVGAFAYLTPLPLAATAILFIAAVAVTRYISLGSILGAACFPLAVFLISHPPAAVLGASLLASAFIIWRHRSNIERIRAGNENLFSFGGGKS
ncbi:MAG TPA: glycerol-3-phosphate 1-O-acyltransferase PlsY [Bryobacteraceae bacterium]|nr:glycerol-3-phosphate 1-O-acyltransferase PlsY [Bryobacteraceae bacterium]